MSFRYTPVVLWITNPTIPTVITARKDGIRELKDAATFGGTVSGSLILRLSNLLKKFRSSTEKMPTSMPVNRPVAPRFPDAIAEIVPAIAPSGRRSTSAFAVPSASVMVAEDGSTA